MSYRLLSITWFLDSPYGTFVSGDYIEVWWDNENSVFIVYKNAVEITSGDDIPYQSWNFAGLPDTDYKEETPYQNSICNGLDLLNFFRKPAFPYLGYTPLLNHASCVVVDPDDPIVCDLAFSSLPVITNASTVTAFDGSITVVATSSNGSIKYKLNADFEYNDGTGQTSGTFSNLSRGDYLVYARDEINCIAVIGVSIGVVVSYGVKYVLEYYDNRLSAHHKTEILEKDYAGSAIEIKAGAVPTVYSLGLQGETNKFIPILSSDLTFVLMSETDGYFRELYTNDPEKYRLRHSIDYSPYTGYEILWTGKMLPNQFREAYKSPPYEIQAVAHDGLATLKDLYLLDDIGNRLTGRLKQITLIAWILKKIGLELNIRSACNIYALTMNSTDSDDPLDQAYVDVERYYLLSSTPTCWDVLSYIFEPYGAQIIQWNNVWNIIRVEERFSAFDYREYDADGDYVSNGSYDPVINLKNAVESNRVVWKNQDQELNINPGYGNLRLLYNLGLKTNLVINGDFNVKNYATFQTNVAGNLDLVKGTIPDLTGFQIVNNECIITTGVEYFDDGNVALELICDNHPSSVFDSSTFYKDVGYLLSDIQTLKMGNTDNLKITYRVKLSPLTPTTAFWVKAKIKIIYGDYFLTKQGEWTTTDTDIKFYIERDKFNRYQDFEVISEGFPDTSYLSGQPFYVICYCANYYDTSHTSLANFKTITTVDKEPGERAELGYLTSNYNYFELEENTDTDDDVTIIRPNDYNVSTNPVQWIRKHSSGTVRMTSPPNGVCKLSIDKIQVEYQSNFKSLPEVSSYQQAMENLNNLNLDKTIYHGSLIYNGLTTKVHHEYEKYVFRAGTTVITFDEVFYRANSANITYNGYLRDSNGVGFTLWSRDSIVGEKELEKIFIDMITAQYNRPWFSIHGGMTGDLIFSPIDTLNETMDSNRKYYPIYLSIDFRNNFYEAQLLELSDVASASEGAAEFNNDFNLDFTS